MKKTLFIILSLFTINVLAEIENTLALTSNNYQDTKNSVILDYKAKTFFELGDESVVYANLEFLADNNDNTLVNPIELKYKLERDNYNAVVGFDTVFWGVAESYNPVDVLNRKNLLTPYDNKDKLGEFMISGEYFFPDSTLGLYYLPKFYQQEFLNKDTTTGIDINKHIIENDKNSFALRYKNIIDNIDLGISYFNGVSRNYNLVPNNAKFDIIYPDLEQTGLDIQLTTENALYKLEYINKQFTGKSAYNLVAGIEYIFIADIAINGIVEYLKSNDIIPYQNDIMLGLRFDLENTSGTEGILSLIYDMDYHSKILTLTGSSRINNDLKLQANIALYDVGNNDLLLKNTKNNIGVTLNYYF